MKIVIELDSLEELRKWNDFCSNKEKPVTVNLTSSPSPNSTVLGAQGATYTVSAPHLSFKKPLPNISFLNLDNRTKNCFKTEGIDTTEKLLSYKERELLKIPNFGRRSLKNLKQSLAIFKLKLKS